MIYIPIFSNYFINKNGLKMHNNQSNCLSKIYLYLDYNAKFYYSLN